MDVPRGIGGADRSARVTRRRLNPQVVENAAREDLAVGHAVQRDAAGQHEVAAAGGRARRARQPQHDVLGDLLDGERQIHVPLRQFHVGSAPWHPEQPLPRRLVHHAQPGGELEVRHVEDERSVGPHVHELAGDGVGKAADAGAAGVPVRRQAHQLVLAAVDREAKVVGEGGVEEPDRVREVQLAQDLHLAPAAPADRRGRPLADAVDGEDRSLVERRRVEGARRVRQMVFGIEDGVARRSQLAEMLGEQAPHEQLLLDPGGHRCHEAGETRGREPVIGLEQALEFQERLVVERHPRQPVVRHAALAEHVAAGVDGERRVVTPAREALFLRGGDNLPVHQQRGCAVVVEGRDAENGLTRH